VRNAETAKSPRTKSEATGEASFIAEAVEDERDHRPLDLMELLLCEAADSEWITNTFLEDAVEEHPCPGTEAIAHGKCAGEFFGPFNEFVRLSALVGTWALECTLGFVGCIDGELLELGGGVVVILDDDRVAVDACSEDWGAVLIEVSAHVMIRAFIMLEDATTAV
jgi:hypothetical protein